MSYRKAALIFAPLLMLATVLIAGSATGAPATSFAATMNSYREVPAISTLAMGNFTASLNMEGTLDYELSYSDASAPISAAHIHFGQVGVNGGVSAFLCGGGDKPACPGTGGTVTGRIQASDVIGPASQGIEAGNFAELLKAMRRGMTYVNAHSSTFPGGELRGQIRGVTT